MIFAERNVRRDVTRRLAIGIVLAAAVQIVGCDDPIGPADVAGSFTRTGPPGVLGRLEAVRVLADTFFLRSDGCGARRTWVEGTPLESGAATVIIRRSDLSFVIAGDSIGSQVLCPPGRLCAAVERREWSEIGVGAASMRARDGTVALYERIRAPLP